MNIPTFRDLAIKAGQKQYNTLAPCRNGHRANRYTKSNVCVECYKNNKKTESETRKRRHKKLISGLILFTHYAHPGDVEAIELYIKDLLFDRGIK